MSETQTIANGSPRKVGLIQTRGLGDILIALPIAKHFFDAGNDVYWPIAEEYLNSFSRAVPWVNWMAVKGDDVTAFYEDPLRMLSELGVGTIIPLYSNHRLRPEITNRLLSSVLKFDQYKYAVAGVEFSKKWDLHACITRDEEREDALYGRLVKNETYIVVHRQGSDFKKEFNIEPSDEYQIIEISDVTDSVFDWLKILEKASGFALVDSVFSNLVDQLHIGSGVPSKYFGLRSGVQDTPVLASHWQYL